MISLEAKFKGMKWISKRKLRQKEASVQSARRLSATNKLVTTTLNTELDSII
jgi:hypothetical protein